MIPSANAVAFHCPLYSSDISWRHSLYDPRPVLYCGRPSFLTSLWACDLPGAFGNKSGLMLFKETWKHSVHGQMKASTEVQLGAELQWCGIKTFRCNCQWMEILSENTSKHLSVLSLAWCFFQLSNCWLYLLSADCKSITILMISASFISAKTEVNSSEYIDPIILSDILFSTGNKCYTRDLLSVSVVNITHEKQMIFSFPLSIVYWSPMTC